MWKHRVDRAIRGALALIACAVIGYPVSASAQPSETEATGPAAQHVIDTAPVVVDGVTLFRVRGVTAFPAEERARRIVDQIEAFARDKTLPANAVEVRLAADRSELVAGRYRLMGVFDADAAIEEVRRSVLADIYRQRIERAVASYRAERAPDALLQSSLHALGAVTALVATLLVLHIGFKRLQALVTRRFKDRVRDLHIQSFRFLQAEQLWSGLQALLRLIYWLLLIAAVLAGLDYVLHLYPWTRDFGQRLADIVLRPLAVMGGGIAAALPGLVFLAILFLLTRYLLKMVRLFFDAVARGAVKLEAFDAEWAWPTYRLIRLLVIAFAIIVGYPYIPGSSSDAFKGVSLFLGVIFSLGSTSIMANILAGYTMTYRRAFRVGDRVRIGEHVGDILEVRLLVTRLRTLKREEVVIPNSVILNSDVINYSTAAQDVGVILSTTVGIGYETPWRQVEAMLLKAAERTEGLLREPPPFVLQTALGDFCVTYQLNVFCDQPQLMPRLQTALHRNILDVFNEYGVQIMTPAYEGDTPQPKIVPKEQWHLPPAAPRAD